jgi:putative DNA primase/helicase
MTAGGPKGGPMMGQVNSADGPDAAETGEIADGLTLFCGPDDAVELRALEAEQSFGRPATECGYFDAGHLTEMARAARRLTVRSKGVYVTLNPVQPALLARSKYRVRPARAAATDAQVVARRRLLLDFDPVRAGGVPDVAATDGEHDAAIAAAREAWGRLRRLGWPEPAAIDSGNGAYLIYGLALDNNPAGTELLRRVTAALSARFSTEAVKLDESTFNAARVVRIPGTLNRKGDHAPELGRPHRAARILRRPQGGGLAPVPAELLLAAASEFEGPRARGRREPPGRNGALSPGDDFDLRGPDFLEILGRHGWVGCGRRGEVTYLTRPGKGSGASATVGFCRGGRGEPLLHVFSDQADPFRPGQSYGRFRAYTLLEHGGDARAAAEALAAEGYGRRGRGAKRPAAGGAGPAAGRNGKPSPPPAGGPGGGDELGELLEVLAADPQVNEAEDDPYRLASLFLDRHRHPPGDLLGVRTLRLYQGQWYCWDGSAYRELPAEEVRAGLHGSIKEEFNRLNLAAIEAKGEGGEPDAEGGGGGAKLPTARKLDARLFGSCWLALGSMAYVSSAVTMPSWLEWEGAHFTPPFPAAEALACRNAVLHLPSLVANRADAAVVAPTPRLFSANALDYDFDPDAPAPAAWLDFLARVWPEDPQSRDALQEWFGYALLPDTSQQKILAMIGPSRCGKGTIARVLRALCGPQNAAGPTVGSLTTNFGLSQLLGKTLAIIPDARLSRRTDTAVVVERLLAISGEDEITVDRKNLPLVTTKLSTRFVVISNELPKLGDASGAPVRRFVLLRFTESWLGEEDTALTGRLLTELPGILLWSIEGWRRLRERGHFVQPESGAELLSELDDLSSPVGQFVREACAVAADQEVGKDTLFAAWQAWCGREGRREPGEKVTFGRNLRAAAPRVKQCQRTVGARREWWYQGIALNDIGKALLRSATQGDGHEEGESRNGPFRVHARA